MATGRPVELTRSVIEDAVRLIPRSLYVETVAHALGIHKTTFYAWLKAGSREQRRRERGRPADPRLDLHCEFSNAVKRAIAETEIDHLSSIQAAGTESWQALAWVLERRFLGKWSLNRAELRELRRRLDELERAGGEPQRAKPAARPGRKVQRADVE